MRVLVVKTSSMGDVIHTLPALTDAGKAIANIRFDWVVEESFTEIPHWHPLVDKVIPIALRRWRKNFFAACKSGEFTAAIKNLRAQNYDAIIDAQGLVKSALLARFVPGQRHGLSEHSAREAMASYFYNYQHEVSNKLHAVERVRHLFAKALAYDKLGSVANYGIDNSRLPTLERQKDFCLFFHGTTWDSKHWPEHYWQDLVNKTTATGLEIYLPWGNAKEKQRAESLAALSERAKVLPKQSLSELASLLSQAKAAVAVDTGLGHLAAALEVPTISLYGPTDPARTGTVGAKQMHLAADWPCMRCLQETCHYQGLSAAKPACFQNLTPDVVWQQLRQICRPD